MSAPIPIYQVDAFTDVPFAGNPAAVCLLGSPRDAAWMQALALEMNLSETAYPLRNGDAWGLRWFTPAIEVDFCGHATVASAHVLWETEALAPSDPIGFDTRSGRLTCTRRDGWIALDAPTAPVLPGEPNPMLLEALGIESADFAGSTKGDAFLLLEDETAVRALQPDFRALKQCTGRGVIVTAPGAGGVDFVSRFFAPAAGIDEDPVTGSIHAALGPWWAERLGRTQLVARQVSARGGSIRLEAGAERTVILGQAVTVMRGELLA